MARAPPLPSLALPALVDSTKRRSSSVIRRSRTQSFQKVLRGLQQSSPRSPREGLPSPNPNPVVSQEWEGNTPTSMEVQGVCW